jgi:hypothetical protein
MTRRCNRCRAEYETGADYGGHDYCMTCYVLVRQEADFKRRLDETRRQDEEKRRIDLEKRRQLQLDRQREHAHKDYMRREKEKLDRLRAGLADEDRRQKEYLANKRLEAQAQLRRMREREERLSGKKRAASEEPMIFTPLGRKKKKRPSLQQAKKPGEEPGASQLARAARKELTMHKPALPLAPSSLSLAVSSELPVSLSIGQKQVSARLLGKNESASAMSVRLEAMLLDSHKHRIAAKAEPRSCTIGASAEADFRVEFDLPEDAAQGRLSLTALLKENAVYIDRQSSQSNTVSLSSQVKTPMDLQYVQGSAALESGSLLLSFNNVGQSGGILETSSSATLFAKEGEGKAARLSSRTKVKGGQKGIRLSFSPADGQEVGRLEISLSGKDSNGKPYSLKMKAGMPGKKEKA